MYTKEKLENMNFKQLKSIAQQMNISRKLTSKREIIDSLLNSAFEEDLDMITVTLVSSSDTEQEKSDEENVSVPRKAEMENRRKTRSALRRLPKPRMTIFQAVDNETLDSQRKQNRKGNVKYFESPRYSRKSVSKMEESVRPNDPNLVSVKERKPADQKLSNWEETQNSLISTTPMQLRRSTRNFTPSDVSVEKSTFAFPKTNVRITRRTRRAVEIVDSDQTLSESECPQNKIDDFSAINTTNGTSEILGRKSVSRSKRGRAKKVSSEEDQELKDIDNSAEHNASYSQNKNITFTTESGQSIRSSKKGKSKFFTNGLRESLAIVKMQEENELKKSFAQGLSANMAGCSISETFTDGEISFDLVKDGLNAIPFASSTRRGRSQFKNDLKDVPKNEKVDDWKAAEGVKEIGPEINRTFQVDEVDYVKPAKESDKSGTRRTPRQKSTTTPKPQWEPNKTSSPKGVKEIGPEINRTFQVDGDDDVKPAKESDNSGTRRTPRHKSTRTPNPHWEPNKTSSPKGVKEIGPEINGTFEVVEDDNVKPAKESDKSRTRRTPKHKNTRTPNPQWESNKTSSPKGVKEIGPEINGTFQVDEDDNVKPAKESDKSRTRRTPRHKSTRTPNPQWESNKTSSPKGVKEIGPEINRTFQVDEDDDVKPAKESDKSGTRKTPRQKSSRTPKPQWEPNRTSSPKGLADKENEISIIDLGSDLNDTYELSVAKDASFTVEKSGNSALRKRRSRSCPQEVQEASKALKPSFFSPSTKSLTKTKASAQKGTPIQNTRIPRMVRKMPDFGSIHKKAFEKMESVVENHQRKQVRAKLLMTPKPLKNAPFCFTARSMESQSPLRKAIPRNQIPVATFKFNAGIALQKPALSSNVFSSNRQLPEQLLKKQNARDVIAKKLPAHKRENIIKESRTAIKGVRLNRRFELQMAHRKLN